MSYTVRIYVCIDMQERVCLSVVTYAPFIGALGLDMARKCSREKAFSMTQSGGNLNDPVPWYPECSGYNVCEIKDGTVV